VRQAGFLGAQLAERLFVQLGQHEPAFVHLLTLHRALQRQGSRPLLLLLLLEQTVGCDLAVLVEVDPGCLNVVLLLVRHLSGSEVRLLVLEGEGHPVLLLLLPVDLVGFDLEVFHYLLDVRGFVRQTGRVLVQPEVFQCLEMLPQTLLQFKLYHLSPIEFVGLQLVHVKRLMVCLQNWYLFYSTSE